jgi:hypothetical protein
MGSKMEASLAVEGKFSEEGLLAMTQGEDITTAMAKALTEGLNMEGAEQIWKKLNQANIKRRSEKEEVTISDEKPMPTPEKKKEDPNKVVFVDFVTYINRRKKIEKKTLTLAELERVAKEKQAAVQLSLFG